MTWLLSKLASQTVLSEGDISQPVAEGSGSTFYENILKPDEEEALMSLPKYATYCSISCFYVMLFLGNLFQIYW
jgi:hypothetical protein